MLGSAGTVGQLLPLCSCFSSAASLHLQDHTSLRSDGLAAVVYHLTQFLKDFTGLVWAVCAKSSDPQFRPDKTKP